jgi:predicted regulator of Ras-like GTPase activity (Roadblock/LC7/MglB family)
MDLKKKIGDHLDRIKLLKGVENAVLTQRDGNPIQSTGVWFSKDEIFNVSSATSAIYNIGIHLHPDDLKYLLIEGKKAKILIAPLSNNSHYKTVQNIQNSEIINKNHEFFVAITALANVNLGGIFMQTNECLRKIRSTLIDSGRSFKPPLVSFSEKNVQHILHGFQTKEHTDQEEKLNLYSLSLRSEDSKDLKNTLRDFNKTINNLKYAFISLEGGFIASNIIKNGIISRNRLDNISAMSYSLFQTANRCAWLLKKMRATNILLDCKDTYQFIHGLKNAVFTTEIGKKTQKLGLLRLFLPKFLNRMDKILIEASKIENSKKFDLNELIGEVLIK